MKVIDIEIEGLKCAPELKNGDWCKLANGATWKWTSHQNHTAFANGLLAAGAKFYRPTECEEGYRWLTDEERSKAQFVGEWLNAKGIWVSGTWFTSSQACSRMRIKLESPERFIKDGIEYEVVTDPEYVLRAGDLLDDTAVVKGGWYHATDNPSNLGKPVSYWQTAPYVFRVARPISPVEAEEDWLETEANNLPNWIVNEFDPPLTNEERVRITKVKA